MSTFDVLSKFGTAALLNTQDTTAPPTDADTTAPRKETRS